MTRAILREIRIHLRREVNPISAQQPGLDVKAAFRRMHGEDRRGRYGALREPAKSVFDRLDARVRCQQPFDVGSREQQGRHVFILIGWPIAFKPEWPLFMYRASKPASRSLIAVLQPTWNP